MKALIEKTLESPIIENIHKTAIQLKYPLRKTSILKARNIKTHFERMRSCGEFSREDRLHFTQLDNTSNWFDFEWSQLQVEEKYYKQYNPDLHKYKTQDSAANNSSKNRWANIVPYDWSRVVVRYGQPRNKGQQK